MGLQSTAGSPLSIGSTVSMVTWPILTTSESSLRCCLVSGTLRRKRVILDSVGREHWSQRAKSSQGLQAGEGGWATAHTVLKRRFYNSQDPLEGHMAPLEVSPELASGCGERCPKDPSNIGHSQLSLRTPGSTLSSESRVPSSVSPYVEGGVAASISSLPRGRLS